MFWFTLDGVKELVFYVEASVPQPMEVTMSDRDVHVGIVQAQAQLGDLDRNLDTLRRMAGQAVRRGADIVVTPELFATGYDPAGAWTHDGEEVRLALRDIAAQLSIALMASSVDTSAGQHFIAASFFTPEGEELARVHKRHLYGEDERQHFTPGDDYATPIEWRGHTWGMGICYDVEFPEFGRSQALRGADVILVPTAVPVLEDPGPHAQIGRGADFHRYDASVTSTLQVPVRALENGVYIAYANHCGEGFTGQSCIASPSGQHAALLGPSEEAVAVVPIDSAFISHSRRLNTYMHDLSR